MSCNRENLIIYAVFILSQIKPKDAWVKRASQQWQARNFNTGSIILSDVLLTHDGRITQPNMEELVSFDADFRTENEDRGRQTPAIFWVARTMERKKSDEEEEEVETKLEINTSTNIML